MRPVVRIERTGVAAKPSIVAVELARELGPRTANFTDAIKKRLRDDTRSGLGSRLANTWRSRVYPVSRPSRTLNPAGIVTSNASTVVAAFDPGATIQAKGGAFMAIPTEFVPKAGRNGRKLTPVEVEARFNQELEAVPSLTRRGVILLVLTARRGKRGVKAIRAKSKAAFFRQAERIVMFVLVPRVRLKKLLDWRRILSTAQADYAREIAAGTNIALLRIGAA
jgi:hypothetical protein